MPEVKSVDFWKYHDFLLIGSSGFWEMQNFQNKELMDKIRLLFQQKLATFQRNKPSKKQIDEFQVDEEVVQSVLHEILDNGIGKEPPQHGKPPKIKGSNQHKTGYENITIVMLRFIKRPELPQVVDLIHYSDKVSSEDADSFSDEEEEAAEND